MKLSKKSKKKNWYWQNTQRHETPFEINNEGYYEPTRIGNAFSGNYIEYERNGDKHETLSIKECLTELRLYLSNMIIDFKTQGECKIYLTIAINFCSPEDSKETRTTHSKNDSIEIAIGYDTNEIIEEFNNKS